MTKILNSEQYIANYNKINEGAGAAYDVVFDGLEILPNTIKTTSGWLPYKSYEGKNDGFCMFWEANLKKCVLEKWLVKDYYNEIDSDGDDYFEYLLPDDRTVNGGVVRGLVFMDDVYGYEEGIEPTSEQVVAHIKDELSSQFKISMKYGWGWSHVDLENPVAFGISPDPNLKEVTFRVLNNEVGELDYIHILYAETDAPTIVDNINYWFKHREDVYSGNDEFDETNEAYKPVDIVDLDRELEILWQKIYNSIKRILKMNGYGEEQHLILDNPESSLISQIGTVVLRNDNLFVTFKNNKDRYVFVEDLKDDDFYELYRCVCKTVENLND